jgi:hypothetical protein
MKALDDDGIVQSNKGILTRFGPLPCFDLIWWCMGSI